MLYITFIYFVLYITQFYNEVCYEVWVVIGQNNKILFKKFKKENKYKESKINSQVKNKMNFQKKRHNTPLPDQTEHVFNNHLSI